MNEHDVAELIQDSITQFIDDSESDHTISIQSFEQFGMLSMNTGLVITIDNKEFAITIQQRN
jgi:hypothetical protein